MNPAVYHKVCFNIKWLFSTSSVSALPIVTTLMIENKIRQMSIAISTLNYDTLYISSPLLSYTIYVIYTTK